MSKFYDREGKVITFEEWGNKFKESNYQRVLLSEFENDARISTVWLGMDHSFGHGRLLIFETMVFADNDSEDMDMDRYSTLEEAKKGHQLMLDKWLKKGYKLLEASNENIT